MKEIGEVGAVDDGDLGKKGMELGVLWGVMWNLGLVGRFD